MGKWVIFSTFIFTFLGPLSIGYKNIPVSIDDAPKAVQAERNVETIISARSAQRIECVGGKVRWTISSH